MSQDPIIDKHKKNDRPNNEQECMMKFYEPITKKQKVLNKWRRKSGK